MSKKRSGDGGIRTICPSLKPSKYQYFRGSQLSIVSICQHKKKSQFQTVTFAFIELNKLLTSLLFFFDRGMALLPFLFYLANPSGLNVDLIPFCYPRRMFIYIFMCSFFKDSINIIVKFFPIFTNVIIVKLFKSFIIASIWIVWLIDKTKII